MRHQMNHSAAVAAVALLVASAVVAGCKSRSELDKENAKRVTADSEVDATKAVVDEDYRFRIDWPGTGWKLLDEETARQMSPDAVGGAIYNGNVFGVVVVEHAPGMTLDAMGDLLIENMPLTDKQILAQEEITFASNPARRFLVTGVTRGVPVRYMTTLFIYQDYAYQLVSWTILDSVPNSDLEKFAAAFSLTEGAVTGRESAQAIIDNATGVGWRLVDGVFESALTGLRARPVGNWRVAIGAELAGMNSSADVGMVGANPEAYLVLLVEGAPETGVDAMVESLRTSVREALAATSAGEEVAATFLGQPVVLSRLKGEMPIEYLHGVHVEGDRVIQILGHYIAGLGEKGTAAVTEALGGISMMAPAERKRLIAELEALPDTQNAVGADFSLRRGVYRHFAAGVTWKAPKGFWRVSVGDAAREENSDYDVYLEEVSAGIYGGMIIEDSVVLDSAGYHQAVITNAGLQNTSQQRSRAAGNVTTLVTDGSLLVGALDLHYRVATAVKGQTAVQLLFWGLPGDMKRHSSVIDDGISTLSIGDTGAASERLAGRYVDHRMGFSIGVPEGWSFVDETPEPVRAIGAFPRWTSGDKYIAVLAICMLEAGQDENWFNSFLEQIVRENFGKGTWSEPKRGTATLAKMNARHLSWKFLGRRIDALIVTRDRSSYAILVAGPGSETFEQARSSFQFVD